MKKGDNDEQIMSLLSDSVRVTYTYKFTPNPNPINANPNTKGACVWNSRERSMSDSALMIQIAAFDCT